MNDGQNDYMRIFGRSPDDNVQPQMQAPQVNKVQPQTQASQVNTVQPQTQAPQVNTVQPQTQAPQVNTVQPQTQAPQINTVQPQMQAPQINTAQPMKKNKTSMFVILLISVIGLIGLIVFIVRPLLATKIIMDNISDSRKMAYKESTYGYMKLIENTIALSNMSAMPEYEVTIPYGKTCDLEKLSSECYEFYNLVNSTVKGEQPVEGKFVIEADDKITAHDIAFKKYPKYKLSYDGSNVTEQ